MMYDSGRETKKKIMKQSVGTASHKTENEIQKNTHTHTSERGMVQNGNILQNRIKPNQNTVEES